MKTKQLVYLLPIGMAISGATVAQTVRSPSATSTTATSSEGQYRQSSSANGTAVNNSNSTNYNSNNATNAASGAGSNSTTPAASSSSGSSATSPLTKTATSTAVSGAQTAPTPAIVAGSTVRNSSIHDFIASSPNYTTLQNALQSAQLYSSLKEGDTYTLFAPSNSAFRKLPAPLQAGLLEGRNQDKLKELLAYHLIEGKLDKEELTKRINANNGKTQLRTLSGRKLGVKLNSGGQVVLTDESGHTALIDFPDKQQTNGVVHGVDRVLLPTNAKDIR